MINWLDKTLITTLLDIVGRAFVSWEIIDVAGRVEFIQALNTIVSGIIMIVPSVFTIFKLVELHKHQVTMTATKDKMTITSDCGSSAKEPAKEEVKQTTSSTDVNVPLKV